MNKINTVPDLLQLHSRIDYRDWRSNFKLDIIIEVILEASKEVLEDGICWRGGDQQRHCEDSNRWVEM